MRLWQSHFLKRLSRDIKSNKEGGESLPPLGLYLIHRSTPFECLVASSCKLRGHHTKKSCEGDHIVLQPKQQISSLVPWPPKGCLVTRIKIHGTDVTNNSVLLSWWTQLQVPDEKWFGAKDLDSIWSPDSLSHKFMEQVWSDGHETGDCTQKSSLAFFYIVRSIVHWPFCEAPALHVLLVLHVMCACRRQNSTPQSGKISVLSWLPTQITIVL